jgi:hypothetical protein
MRYRTHVTLLAAAMAVAAIGSRPLDLSAQARPRDGQQQAGGGQERPRSVARPPEAPRQAPAPRETEPAREPEQRRAVPRAESAPRNEPDARQRQAEPRREPPRRVEIQPRYRSIPRVYYFPPIDVRLGYYYHPYFGFYYGPYYGPYYPYPGPYDGPVRYSAAAVRTRVKPVETAVYVNGYFAGIVDDFDGVFQRLYLPAGEHVIDFHLAGYLSFQQRIYVAPGSTFEIAHQMLALRPGQVNVPPPAPRAVPGEWTEPPQYDTGDRLASPFGILAVRTEPADAQVYIDGEAWAGFEGAREFVIHLPAGWHQLEVRKDGYQPFSTKIELSEGQTTRLNVSLLR